MRPINKSAGKVKLKHQPNDGGRKVKFDALTNLAV